MDALARRWAVFDAGFYRFRVPARDLPARAYPQLTLLPDGAPWDAHAEVKNVLESVQR